jgi:hypothetical protein
MAGVVLHDELKERLQKQVVFVRLKVRTIRGKNIWKQQTNILYTFIGWHRGKRRLRSPRRWRWPFEIDLSHAARMSMSNRTMSRHPAAGCRVNYASYPASELGLFGLSDFQSAMIDVYRKKKWCRKSKGNLVTGTSCMAWALQTYCSEQG